FYLTPLPGSEDHKKLHEAGVALDPDLNKYDLNPAAPAHAKMSKAEWERAYRLAWKRYYTPDHIDTIFRRAAAMRAYSTNVLFLITWFVGSIRFEHVHPLESGFVRRKFRRDRRSS